MEREMEGEKGLERWEREGSREMERETEEDRWRDMGRGRNR